MAMGGDVCAQDAPVGTYFDRAGAYADIYNGRMELAYSKMLYRGAPYYRNADYVETAVMFRDNYYEHLKARLDLFREQLVVLTPDRPFSIVLDPPKANKIWMYGKVFVWLEPPKTGGMRAGYYMQLLDGTHMQLFGKERQMEKKREEHQQMVLYFDREVRYYLLHDGQWRPVKNRASFTRMFPQYKKQIKRFAKEQRLDFRERPEESLAALTAYCESIIYLNKEQ
jgi:hypothetical protein